MTDQVTMAETHVTSWRYTDRFMRRGEREIVTRQAGLVAGQRVQLVTAAGTVDAFVWGVTDGRAQIRTITNVERDLAQP